MVVICNGSFKSGSTWIFNLASVISGFCHPPSQYLNPAWVNPSLLPRKFAEFERNEDLARADYIVKNHFAPYPWRSVLLRSPEVRVIHSSRNFRDVIVSAYFHEKRLGNASNNFSEYYWTSGRKTLEKCHRYNYWWENPKSEKIFHLRFEDLKADFSNQAMRLGDFLGCSLSQEEVSRIQYQVSIDKLRKNYESLDKKHGSFFRKGLVGGWENFLDEEIVRDIEKLEKSRPSLVAERLRACGKRLLQRPRI